MTGRDPSREAAPHGVSAALSATGGEPFGPNEVRLRWQGWAWVAALAALLALGIPRVWERVERVATGQDYRIPYALSKDYWLYGRRLRSLSDPGTVVLLGDSVVWGEYVGPDGSLSHFLNQETAATGERFVNGGVNGLFPLAMEGLVDWQGGVLSHHRVLLQCNPLWMTSPKADLSTRKEEPFNHSRLVPQFAPWIPCYRADAHERISAWMEQHVEFLSWVGHLQSVYFDGRSIPSWTLVEETGTPPRHPNLVRNPLARITLEVSAEVVPDPLRGVGSPRHKPWKSEAAGGTQFEWVPLEASLQWGAFRRVIQQLRGRGADLFVVIGPFNEAILAEENRPAFHRIRDGMASWMESQGVPHCTPDPLPSPLYADASHPLTEGYALLAKRLLSIPAFHLWVQPPGPAGF